MQKILMIMMNDLKQLSTRRLRFWLTAAKYINTDFPDTSSELVAIIKSPELLAYYKDNYSNKVSFSVLAHGIVPASCETGNL